MKIRAILIFVIAIVIAFCSMFVVVNADKIFFNNNVEQVEPGENETETPGGTETPDDNEEQEPIQPGEDFTINISKNQITF